MPLPHLISLVRDSQLRTLTMVMVLSGICMALTGNTAYASRCDQLTTQPDAWMATNVDLLVRAARRAYESDKALPAYEKVLDEIARTLRECGLVTNERFTNRNRAFVEFIQTVSLERQPDHELCLNVSDKQYFKETRQFVEIPSFLLNQTFLKYVSRYETLGRAKSLLRQFNTNRSPSEQLIFFSYKSRHLGTPDNDASYRRLLIVVPGDPEKGMPDKWVQFGVTDPGARARVRNLSVVSAVPGANGTFNAYFKDFYRTYRRDGSIAVDGRWELKEGDDNCAQCHKSGILPIFPVRGSVVAAEQRALAEVNERFRAYGSPRFGGYLDPTKLGPGLGAANVADRRRRFGTDSDQTPAARAMVCSTCHNSERLGALNWPMDKKLIKSYVTGGQMPFGQQLSISERRELYAKLVDEYFATNSDNAGILKSWLLGRSQ
ncbi:MAG TPA: hypothetical protein VMZ30_15880 [Pyrinomonadaceae bacterium]|nr:hypothetical protein [Pyrinomonadaceae bacterium]